jgi:hypothetical protein
LRPPPPPLPPLPLPLPLPPFSSALPPLLDSASGFFAPGGGSFPNPVRGTATRPSSRRVRRTRLQRRRAGSHNTRHQHGLRTPQTLPQAPTSPLAAAHHTHAHATTRTVGNERAQGIPQRHACCASTARVITGQSVAAGGSTRRRGRVIATSEQTPRRFRGASETRAHLRPWLHASLAEPAAPSLHSEAARGAATSDRCRAQRPTEFARALISCCGELALALLTVTARYPGRRCPLPAVVRAGVQDAGSRTHSTVTPTARGAHHAIAMSDFCRPERSRPRRNGTMFRTEGVVSACPPPPRSIWQLPSPPEEVVLHGHTAPVNCVVECHGLVVTGSDDGSLRVWDAIRCICVHIITAAHSDGVAAMAVFGRLLVSGGKMRTLKVRPTSALAGCVRSTAGTRDRRVDGRCGTSQHGNRKRYARRPVVSLRSQCGWAACSPLIETAASW